MATIKFDGIVGEARGAVGDTVYSRNQYGAYVKTRTTPINPSTAPQVDWRGRLATAVAAWGALTQSQRDMYYAQAKNFYVRNRVGDRVKINGYNLFIRQQMIISKSGNQGTISNPVAAFTGVYQILALGLTAADYLVQYTSENPNSNTLVTIKASPPRPAGHPSFNPSTCVIISEGEQLSPGTDVINVSAAYAAVHGAIAGTVGMYVTIGFQSFDQVTGQRSENFFLSQIVLP